MPTTDGVIRMPGRTTVLQGVPIIHPSGKPTYCRTRNVPVCTPLIPQHRQEIQSEYERSYRSFERYQYKNNRWTVIRRPVAEGNEWMNEVIDTRKRALENKAKIFGDHFTLGEDVRGPSRSISFWEALPNDGFYNSLAEFDKQDVGLDRKKIDSEQISSLPAAITTRRPRSANVAVQTSSDVILYPSVTAISQATQTSENTEISSQVQSQTIPDKEELSNNAQVSLQNDEDPTDEAKRYPNFDNSRLEILKKARYVDARDNSLAMSAPVHIRSGSLKSIFNAALNRSTTNPFLSPAPVQNSLSKTWTSDRIENELRPVRASSVEPRKGNMGSRHDQTTDFVRTNQSIPSFVNRSGEKSTNSGQFLPVSAFTISPPRRRSNSPAEKQCMLHTNDTITKKPLLNTASPAWDIPPPPRDIPPPPRKPINNSSSFQSRETRARTASEVRNKQRGFAWIEL